MHISTRAATRTRWYQLPIIPKADVTLIVGHRNTWLPSTLSQYFHCFRPLKTKTSVVENFHQKTQNALSGKERYNFSKTSAICTNDSVSTQRTSSKFLGRDSRLHVACYVRKTKLHAFGTLRSCSAADFLRHAHLSLSHRDGSSTSRKLFDHATKLDMPHSQRISSTRYLTTSIF